MTDLAIPTGDGTCQLAIKAYTGAEYMIGTWLMKEYTFIFDQTSGIGFTPISYMDRLPSIENLSHDEIGIYVCILVAFVCVAICCCICCLSRNNED